MPILPLRITARGAGETIRVWGPGLVSQEEFGIPIHSTTAGNEASVGSARWSRAGGRRPARKTWQVAVLCLPGCQRHPSAPVAKLDIILVGYPAADDRWLGSTTHELREPTQHNGDHQCTTVLWQRVPLANRLLLLRSAGRLPDWLGWAWLVVNVKFAVDRPLSTQRTTLHKRISLTMKSFLWSRSNARAHITSTTSYSTSYLTN